MKYICTLFFLTICFNAGAGIYKHRIFMNRLTQMTADTDTLARKRSVSAGISYGSDASFFGRTGPVKYPFLNTDVIYNTKSGIFAYGSAYKVLGSTPTIDETDLGVGYLYNFSKKFSGNISYTRFIFDKNALIIKSASSNDINFKNTYDWKFIKSSVILDYLFGESSDFFLTVSNSKYFETNWSVFDDKDYLSFTPSINIIFGTQNFVQKYSTNHPGRLDDNDQDLVPPLSGTQKYARDNSEFNALNYSFKIPIAYNRPHYTIEASYKYSIPVNVEGILKNHKESFYNLTFYYVFY
ncbi:MAG: hypothetical protein JWP37_2567 [Mucilaginibacter sp.]|nr:hypothetical protein [Mucilaginibacter sp.]